MPYERIDVLVHLAHLQEEKFLKADLAAAHLEQVLEIDPNHEPAYDSLERCYRQRRQWLDLINTYDRHIGATLDRNGLRPARYLVTDDDLVVMASESGVLPIPENRIVRKWRLQPGKMFLIDFEQGRIVDDEELKAQFASAKPYRQWIESVRVKLEELPAGDEAPGFGESLLDRQQAFGYTQEDIKFLLAPMAANGEEALLRARVVKPAMVILDLLMPGIDGFETCKRLKQDPEVSHIPVVMVTALSEPSDRVAGLEAGADDFITKPFTTTDLLARARAHARHQREVHRQAAHRRAGQRRAVHRGDGAGRLVDGGGGAEHRRGQGVYFVVDDQAPRARVEQALHLGEQVIHVDLRALHRRRRVGPREREQPFDQLR